MRTLKHHSLGVTAVALSSDRCRAVSGSHDRTLKVWDLGSGRQPGEIQGHARQINAVAVSGNGDLAVSGDGSAGSPGDLKVWDNVSVISVIDGIFFEITDGGHGNGSAFFAVIDGDRDI
jgi:WD40 repeat protein